jgi:hypothetical protein
VAPDGTCYVSDGYAKAVWKIPPGSKPAKWVAGGPLVNPVGLAWKGGNLLIADPHARAIFAATPNGKTTRVRAEPAD